MITVTAAQAAIIVSLVGLLKASLITFAQYQEHLNRIMNLRDEELEEINKVEEEETELLMQKLEEI